MGTRYVGHRDLLIYKDCVSKNPFGGGSGSEEYTVFCQEGLVISGVLALSPFLVALRSIAVLYGKWRWETLTATGMRPSAE